MTRNFDVVVVGGGVMGLFIAIELRRQGVASVALFERRFLGAGSSGKSGAILRQHYSHVQTIRMARASLFEFAGFAERTGLDIGFARTGMLFIAPEDEHAALESNVTLQREQGVQVTLLDAEGLRDLLPHGRYERVVAAWEPEAGYVDPVLTVGALGAEASRLGVHVFEGVEVTAVRATPDGGRVVGVDTSDGHAGAGALVAAAGPWSARLAATLGLSLPLEVVRPEQAFLRPPASQQPPHPVVADLPNAVYYKPEPGATRVGNISYDDDERINDPDDYDESVSHEFLRECRRRVARRFSDYERAVLWGGGSALYTVTPDAHALIGPLASFENAWLVTGFSGHGFKLSPMVGRGVAEWITRGEPQAFERSFFAPDRFANAPRISTSYRFKILG